MEIYFLLRSFGFFQASHAIPNAGQGIPISRYSLGVSSASNNPEIYTVVEIERLN